MLALTPEHVSGLIELRIGLLGVAERRAELIAGCISTWVRAIEIGCFGSGRVRIVRIQEQGDTVLAELQGERLPASALDGLSRLLRHLSATQTKLNSIDLLLDGRTVELHPEVVMPEPPAVLPFELEYPADLKPFLRIEIEFRAALPPTARDEVFDAFAVWDVLVAAFGDIQRWRDRVDLKTRLLSPRIVEHQVDGYFASFDCLYPVVLMALRLHPRMPIERLILE